MIEADTPIPSENNKDKKDKVEKKEETVPIVELLLEKAALEKGVVPLG